MDGGGGSSLSEDEGTSSDDSRADCCPKIMNAKALKVSGINAVNRRSDCNGVYELAGTRPAYHHNAVPYFRNAANDYYL